jgi:hypothetical protein
MIAKSRPRWLVGEPVDVLEEHVLRAPALEDVVDRPPEHAFDALEPSSLARGFGNGVVLAGEATNKQIVRRHLIDDRGDVLVDQGAVGPVGVVAVGGVLNLGRGLPLVGPDGSPTRPLQGKAEPAHACEELNDPVVRAPRPRRARASHQHLSQGRSVGGRITPV